MYSSQFNYILINHIYYTYKIFPTINERTMFNKHTPNPCSFLSIDNLPFVSFIEAI